jgi:hypothetical protein
MSRRLSLSLATVGAIAVAAALVTTGLTFASSASTPSVAYAQVNPNGGAPTLVARRTYGFIKITVGPFGPGDYCLTPAPGVSVSRAAVASEEAYLSDDIGIVSVRYPTAGPMCPSGNLEVKTFALDGSGPIDTIGFTVLNP